MWEAHDTQGGKVEMGKLNRYFRGVSEEARRIRWPNARTLFKSVAIVLVIAIVAGASMMLFDWISSEIQRAFQIAFPKSDSTDSTTLEAGIRMLTGWFKNGGLL